MHGPHVGRRVPQAARPHGRRARVVRLSPNEAIRGPRGPLSDREDKPGAQRPKPEGSAPPGCWMPEGSDAQCTRPTYFTAVGTVRFSSFRLREFGCSGPGLRTRGSRGPSEDSRAVPGLPEPPPHDAVRRTWQGSRRVVHARLRPDIAEAQSPGDSDASTPSLFSCGSPSRSGPTESSRRTSAARCRSRCSTIRRAARPSPYTVTFRAMRS